MSTINRAEALVQLLDLDDTFSATRPIGYAYARTVDIEHPKGQIPDRLVHELDPLGRLEGTWEDIWPESAPTEGASSSEAGDYR